jgi:branched-chain amino acid transport system substrate-binding protein
MVRMSNVRLARRVVLGGGLGVAATPMLGAGAARARPADDPLRIGVLVDTSGPASIHGKRQLLGATHQADMINADTPLDRESGVRLFVRDTQGSVDITRGHALALLDKDEVDAFIGTSLPLTAEVVMDVAEAAGVPMIVPTTISPPAQPFVFCSAASSERATQQTMGSLAEASLRRAALLILDSLATPQRLAIYAREAAAHGIELVAVEQFSGSATTLTAPLRVLIAKAPDAILIATPPPFNGLAAQDIRALRWPGPIYCSAGAGHPGFLQQAGPAAEGVHVVGPWLLLAERAPDTLPNSWAIRKFVASFTRRHGPVGTFAGYAADAVSMLHYAYFGHRDRHRARETLEHMTYVGATGVFHMSPSNHAGLDDAAFTTVVVRNGTWTATHA